MKETRLPRPAPRPGAASSPHPTRAADELQRTQISCLPVSLTCTRVSLRFAAHAWQTAFPGGPSPPHDGSRFSGGWLPSVTQLPRWPLVCAAASCCWPGSSRSCISPERRSCLSKGGARPGWHSRPAGLFRTRREGESGAEGSVWQDCAAWSLLGFPAACTPDVHRRGQGWPPGALEGWEPAGCEAEVGLLDTRGLLRSAWWL